MKPTREQCLEWALEASEETSTIEKTIHMPPTKILLCELESLIRRAHAEGQRDMRERAVLLVKQQGYQRKTEDGWIFAHAEIRNLEIEE